MNNTTNYPGMDQAGQQGMYQRTASAPNGGTVVPGMQKQASGVELSQPERIKAPVVGFLYSISRNGIGEYWPVCIGPNYIGRNADNDICLPESTVSDKHAVMNVKRLKSTGAIVAQIQDTGSKNGIFVNDEELDFGIHECKNNDILRIGDNYQLLLLLINTNEHGLKVSEDFIAADEVPAPPVFGNNFPAGGASPYNPTNRSTNGTQMLDGREQFGNGGTSIL